MFDETIEAWKELVATVKYTHPALLIALLIVYLGFMYLWFFKIVQEDCIRKLGAWIKMCEENSITRLEFVGTEGPNLVLDPQVLNVYINSIRESNLKLRAYKQLWKVSSIFSEENMEKCKEAVILGADREISKQQFVLTTSTPDSLFNFLSTEEKIFLRIFSFFMYETDQIYRLHKELKHYILYSRGKQLSESIDFKKAVYEKVSDFLSELICETSEEFLDSKHVLLDFGETFEVVDEIMEFSYKVAQDTVDFLKRINLRYCKEEEESD